MMLIQEALKQRWDNVREELQLFCAAGWAGWGAGRAGWGGGGDTAHAQLSLAHTHTD